jgi:hypothetical protein
MSYSNRIFFYGPVGLLVLIVVLYSVFWRVTADTLAARLDRSNGGEIIPGVMFAFAEKSVGGFPFRLDVVLDGVTFAHQGPDGETAWRAEKLAIHAQSYDSEHFIFEAAGMQSFALPGLPGGPPRVTLLTPGIARASAILREGRIARFDLDVWEPQGKDATLNAEPNRTLSAARAQFHLLGRPDDTIDIAMKIEGAHIGEGFIPATGSEMQVPLIDLRAKLTQSRALDTLKAGFEDVVKAADDWRRSNGVLNVSDLSLNWAAVRANLKGNLMLDAANRVTGALEGTGTLNGTNISTTVGLIFADGDMRLTASGLGRAVP